MYSMMQFSLNKAPNLVAYTDGVAILVASKFLEALSNVMDNALRVIHQWAALSYSEVQVDKTDKTWKLLMPNVLQLRI